MRIRNVLQSLILLILTTMSIASLAKDLCKVAPEFSLRNQEGTFVGLNDLLIDSNGKLIVLSIFQTTCVPCVEEIKYLQRLKKDEVNKINGRFKIVLIDSNEDRKTTREFLLKNNFIEELVLNDPFGKLDKIYQLITIPKLIIIDAKKNIIFSKEGAELSKLRLSDELRKLFLDPKSASDCATASILKN